MYANFKLEVNIVFYVGTTSDPQEDTTTPRI